MTQFENPYTDPYMSPTGEAARTSGLAITALVFSLLAVIPCLGMITGPVGFLLGLIAMVTIGSNPLRKGKGMAIAAMIIGLVLGIGQIWGGKKMYDFAYGFYAVMNEGPTKALKAGFGGDIAGFKAEFHGAGATASDAEARAFIDQLRSRHGDFISATWNKQSGQQPQPGQTTMILPYTLQFSGGSATADSEIVLADPQSGGVVKKIGSIIVSDPQGDLVYPSGAKTTSSSGGNTRPRGTSPGTTQPSDEVSGDDEP